ncbi:MAG: hypothetical protein PHI62_01615 [Candidatus Methanomethylophilaceae archaeon]|nr:hypothetical protein [Candidatus Methanomethylophilaceae archaeon]
MNAKESANGIIVNVANRDKTDSYVPPAMVSLVILAYIIIMLRYYALTIESFDGALSLSQMFDIMSIFVIGMALVLSIFYLLTARNIKHMRRESTLRCLLADYAEAMGADVRNLRRMDSEIRRQEGVGSYRIRKIALVLPAALGTGSLFFLDLQVYGAGMMILCWALSLIAIFAVAPALTTAPRAHEKRTLPFYEEFNRIAPCIGMDSAGFERVIGVRSFLLFTAISALTAGLFLPVWAFMTFNDMNRHFMEQWYFEDSVIRSLRRAFA